MLITFLVVLGAFSFRDLGVDLFPKADPAVVNISIRLPGATPEEMTTEVIQPLEESLSSVSGLDELQVSATESNARLTCQFVLERDIESAAQDVREKVAAATRKLPAGIDPPIITKADPDADPVLSFVIAGAGSLRETTQVADNVVKTALESVDGVGEVSIVGGQPRQIRVYVDGDKLSGYGITINQVRNAVRDENVEVPGGTIQRQASEVGVRTLGRIKSSEQFNDIIIAYAQGAPIRVRDIGRVEDSYPDPTTWSTLHGKEAVVLNLQRQSGSNTLKVVQAAKDKLVELKRTLPPNINIEMIRDDSTFIKASVASLEEHLLWGSLLASLVVLLFIRSFRSVVIAALAIPTSIIATFTLIKEMGFTLNNMTLLGLTLAVGIVIDDAIVVLENIVRYVEEKGVEPMRAAVVATKEITLAVVATTISLVIIFVPIAFTTGYARVYLNSFGWTMACAVMVSMLVSLTLTPMLCSRMLKAPRPGMHQHKSSDGAMSVWLNRTYTNILQWSLDHRWATVLVAAATFALIVPLNKRVGRDFIPADDQSELNVRIDVPEGMSLDGIKNITMDMAQKIEPMQGVDFVWPAITSEGGKPNIYVRLVDSSKRNFSNLQMADTIRSEVLSLPQYRNLRKKVLAPSALGTGDNAAPIRANVLGPNLYVAAQLAEKGAKALRQVPGLVDVNVNASLNNPELQVDVDRERAANLGVRMSDVGGTVRLMIAGTDQITTYQEGDQQYDVTMQLLPEQQKNPEILERLMVPSSRIGQVRLDSFAKIRQGKGPTEIDRYNRMFRVNVPSANSVDLPFDAALRAVRREMTNVLIPGYSLKVQGAAKALDETTQSLVIAFLLAAIFMYMVLAAQFESFLNPFVIMLSLPLSIPFALLTLWLTHRTLNLWSALGIFLLLGIVKKNGILQVDYTNKLRAEGLPLRDAIIQANQVRLRPILMTTLSIVAGLIPTAMGVGAGATQRSAIAITIIGGQMLCLLLTLVMTPVAYSLLSDLAENTVLRQVHTTLSRFRLGLRQE
jgi:HAE1 family hydrophobic/amphiphilic exporter-1